MSHQIVPKGGDNELTTFVRTGGDDNGLGTLADPLATVIEALRRLMLIQAGYGRRIIDCTGVTETIEKLVVPTFLSGFPSEIDVAPAVSPLFFITDPLEIRAVPAVVQGVTITGNVAGPTAGQRILTVSDVLVPGAHVGQMVQGAAISTAGAIYANDASTISVTTLNTLPGAGAIDIVEPSATLTYGDTSIFSRIAFEISSVYSNAQFTGIKFRNNNAGPGDFSIEARTHGNNISFVMCDIENLNLFGPDFTFDYCHLIGDWQTNGVGGQFRSSFYDAVEFFLHGGAGFGTLIWNGCMFDGCTTIGHGTTQDQEGSFGVHQCLIDNAVNDAIRYAGGNKSTVEDVEINNSGGDAIFAENVGTLEVDNVTGTGNGGYGINAINGAQINVKPATTVTGALGDVFVGAAGVTPYASLPADDLGIGHEVHLEWAYQTNLAVGYAAGFYDFAATDNDFSPLINFGPINAGVGAHFLIVTGAVNVASVTIRVTGDSIDDFGVETLADTEDIVVAAGAIDRYFETAKKWNGQLAIETVAGTPITCNYGFAKYGDHFNIDFTIEDMEVLWDGDSTDNGSNIELLHHKATGWTFNAGAEPTTPTPIAARNTDYAGNTSQRVGCGSWKRNALDVFVAGADSEGVLFRITSGSLGVGSLSFRFMTLEIAALHGDGTLTQQVSVYT